jgi:hypothetical protein
MAFESALFFRVWLNFRLSHYFRARPRVRLKERLKRRFKERLEEIFAIAETFDL